MLPERYADLLPWFLSQSDDVMANLFAFCVAATVDGVSPVDTAHPVNTLGDVLELDMTSYWKATRAGYFDHVSKQRIVDVVSQAVSPDATRPLARVKKADSAAAAELRLTGTNWLPEVLSNHATPQELDDEDDDNT